jgi:hypothetical protein
MLRLISMICVCCAGLMAQNVPTFEAIIGHVPGKEFTPHAAMEAWVRAAASSPRAKLIEYGRTPEGRALLLLVVTSKENHARMTELRTRHGQLAAGVPADQAAALIKDLPPVVWLSHTVHGDEASGTEAALLLMRRLLTEEDAATLNILENTISIIDPCLNPDGRERYVQWYRSVVGTTPDPEPLSAEHDQPWPGGRENHWYFDLNRDWCWMTQPETRARHQQFLAWHPQVHADLHEMSWRSTYFFFPAEKPVNANLPETTLKWGRRFGEGNARAFDARGWPYYTAEDFDLFYPGYGDTWPSLHGAIGMTYEQAGGGRAGSAVRLADGRVLTLAARAAHHEMAAFTTLETAATQREELLRDYAAFRHSAVEEGRTGPVRSFLLPAQSDPRALDALAAVLQMQGIVVQRARDAFTMARVKDALGVAVQDRTFEAGTLVVDLAQPAKRLAKTLLEAKTEVKELFFYDIAAWSLPLAFGVPVFESAVLPEVALLAADEPLAPAGGVDNPNAQVGWLLSFTSRSAVEALSDLLVRGVRVKSAHKEFLLGDKLHARGTLLIRRDENAADVARTLAEVASARRVKFVGCDSGLTAQGIDLGSSSIVPVVPPRIALLGGPGISETSFGATRHILDAVLKAPVSVFSPDDFRRAELARYTAVVVPEGGVKPELREHLKKFAEDGGVVVAFGSAAFQLLPEGAKKESTAAEPKASPEKAPRWIEEREESERRRQQPGSVFRLELDPAHPLNFGARSEIAAFKEGTRAFDTAIPGLHVALFKEAREISGYVAPEDAQKLMGRSYATVVPIGDGAIVGFADDPNFRGAWRATTRLFMNAVLLLPTRQIRRD